MTHHASPGDVAVIGAGPAGLMAAEVLAAAGHAVTVYERMPTAGRKMLMAGRGGLNLTHSEPLPRFLARYGAAAGWIGPKIDAFGPADLVHWAEGLGQPCFTGSSGRIFPVAMKASPLLRAWLARLAGLGVTVRLGHRWQGWAADGALQFRHGDGEVTVRRPATTLLALGGASWPRLGSDGGWAAILTARGIPLAPLRPANCGFAVPWTDPVRRFAGTPLKGIAAAFAGQSVRGEAMVTAYGIEGGAIYALSAALREALAGAGSALLTIDLRPELSVAALAARLARPRGRQSLSTYLRKTLNLAPVAIALMRNGGGPVLPEAPAALAALIKAVPVSLTAPAALDRAISTAGGIRLDALDDALMLRALPGVFAAGEMLDWEAPTGGYLLQACLATGFAAGRGMIRWLAPGSGALARADTAG